ncbi:hypothetical protein BU588_11495 [Staphylococcus agnetis]|nr:hypothetical protein BU588_11495 [Staphylococcus agnetis]
MYKQMKDDLETIIDQFFEEAELARPLNIQPQSEINKDDESIKQKLRDDALAAKYDNSLVDPEVQKRSEKAKAHIAEITKKSREAKAKVEAEKNTKINKSYFKNPKDFKHKIYKPTREAQNGSLNELSIKFPESSQQLPIYTVTSESKTQPVLKQQTKEEKVDVLKSKRPGTTLNGLNGESNLVTIDESANASTQFGSNGHVFEYSFDSTPKTTNVAKQNIKQENYNSVNNLAGMSGESQHVDFTQDSNPTTTYGGYGNAFDLTEDTAPKQPETITESHEIVFDEYTDITVSGFTKGESVEDTNVPTQTNQKN